MITALIPFLGNKWARVGIEVAVVAALIGGFAAYFHSKGKQAGRDEMKQSIQQDLEKQREQFQSDLNAVKADAKADSNQAAAERKDADAKVLAALGTLADIAKKQAAGTAAVNGLKDSDLHPYIVGLLKLRKPGDLMPGYTPDEERALATCVTQYPICQEKLAAKDQQVSAEQQKTDSADKSAAALQKIADGQDAFIQQLNGLFGKLFNLSPPKYRSAKCLWLWKCGEKKLDVSLVKPAPARP